MNAIRNIDTDISHQVIQARFQFTIEYLLKQFELNLDESLTDMDSNTERARSCVKLSIGNKSSFCNLQILVSLASGGKEIESEDAEMRPRLMRTRVCVLRCSDAASRLFSH